MTSNKIIMKNNIYSTRLAMAFYLVFILLTLQAQTTEKTPGDFGCLYIPFEFEGDTVDILIRPNQKDYDKKKPLLLFVQGSLPQPLLKFDKRGRFNTFPFDANIFVKDYHLAIIGKPGIPLIISMDELKPPHYTYKNKETGAFPRKYCQNNHLDYYVNRNKAVLKFLAKKDWVDEKKIVVVGHSEGVQVSLKMAIDKAKMTHLVLLNAGLEGRIMSIITNERSNEKTVEDYQQTEEFFSYWKNLVQHKGAYSDDCSKKDSDKATASFSFPYRKYLHKLKVPVFFGYGTKDESVLLMDNLRLQTITKGLTNFQFKSYFGWEHNFFSLKEDGSINYEDYNFDIVAADFFTWLKTK